MKRTGSAANEWRKAKRAGVFLLGFSCFLSFFTSMLALTVPVFMMLVYDRVLAGRSEATLVSLLILAAILIGIMGLLDFARRRIMARFGAQFQERLEKIVSAAAFAKNARNTRTGSDAVNTSDLDRVRGFLHSASLVSLFDVLWTPLLLGVVFLFDPLLGWLAVVGLGILALITLLKNAFTRPMEAEVKAASRELSRLSQALNVSEELVKSQRMFPAAQRRWSEARNHLRDVTITLYDRLGWYDMLARQLLMLMRAAMLALGAYLVLKGDLSVGAVIAGVVLLSRVFHPIENFLRQLPKIAQARESWARLRTVIEAADKSRRRASLEADIGEGSALQVENLLVKGPGERGAIVRGVSFEAGPGDIIQIIGPSGAGKSVLSRAIINGFPFQGGRLSYGGCSLGMLSEAQLGAIFGYAPERITFFPASVAENIARLDPDAGKGAVVAAARAAGVHRVITALPHSYETPLDILGRPLSTGEARRVALARALYGEPKILVIDESGEMFEAEEDGPALTRTIAEFVEDGGAVVIFAHRPTLAALPSRLYTLKEGRFKAAGRHGPEPAKDGQNNPQEVQWIGKTKPRVISG